MFDIARDAAVAGLVEADRRLAHELAAGVLRHRTELDARLEPLVRRWPTTPDDLRDLLRIGAWQLGELDRVPAYAAVNATVDVARTVAGEGGARFVNAVLRRLSAGGRTPAAAMPGDAATPAELAEAYSHPGWLVSRWVARFGPAATRQLLEHNNRRPALVVQPARWDAAALATALEAAGRLRRVREPGFEVQGPVESLPGYVDGAFVVQDPAQHRLLSAARLPEGELVWDACAAPGGKTAMLARRGPVVASDSVRGRLGRLRDTVRRAAPGTAVLAADAAQPPFDAARFDAVLVDAPCSATGTLARHPDARWRLAEDRLAYLVERQRRLLHGAATVVRPGGLLVYMTCSLEPEENGAQVDAFLAAHPGWRRDGDDVAVFPPDAGTDGGFMARLRETA